MGKECCSCCIVKPRIDAYMDMTGKIHALRDIKEGETIYVEMTSRILVTKDEGWSN